MSGDATRRGGPLRRIAALAPDPAQLHLTLTDRAGNSRTIHKRVVIPPT